MQGNLSTRLLSSSLGAEVVSAGPQFFFTLKGGARNDMVLVTPGYPSRGPKLLKVRKETLKAMGNVNMNIATPSSENSLSCFLSATPLEPQFIQRVFTEHLL